jgi:Rha family phage regulatory protein
MYDLTVFEENGKLLTDSREVSLMVDKDHGKLLRDIRSYCEHLTEANFGLSEYFVASTYQDSTGRKLPRYLCTKMGCDMIANKMIGKKGVIFTAKYIEAFEKMKDFIEKGAQYNKQISFKEQVECIGVVADMLRANDASKLLMVDQLYKSYGLPTEFLPKYEYNGSREMKSATDLLKRYGLGMSAKSFNLLLIEYGYLEERSRKSTSEPGKEKKYKALTDKGLRYGENAVSPQCQREVQPMYYADSFEELFNMVVSQEVA